jgi:flavin-binding protein dodecin
MSEHHVHEHVVQVTASGKSLEDAIANGIAGLTDPKGHHATLTFNAFEVLKITGTISHKPGTHGDTGHIKVLLQALGSHGG